MRKLRQTKKIEQMNADIELKKMASVFFQVRIQRNAKQTDFAKSLGITQGTISKIESGKMAPDVFTYLKFSRQFGVEVL